jgi:hypothetical protein
MNAPLRTGHRCLSVLKEKPIMRRRLIFIAAALSLVLCQAAVASANEPWWHLTGGSRPMNLWAPQSEVQEIVVSPTNLTMVELEGTPVACFGGPYGFYCPVFGLPNDETAADLQNSLEAGGAYGAGNVEVTEDSENPNRFMVKSIGQSSGRYVPALSVVSFPAPGVSKARVLTQGGSGRLIVTATNIGDAPINGSETPVTLVDELPVGLAAYRVDGIAGVNNTAGPLSCAIKTTTKVVCSFEGELMPYGALEAEIFVSLTTGPPGPLPAGTVTLTGGTAAEARLRQEVKVSEAPTPFGIESYAVRAEEEGGGPATQAGSHPFQFTTDLQFNQGRMSPGGRYGSANEQSIQEQPAQPRNLRFTLPPGLVGNASAFPTCSFLDFSSQEQSINKCPASTVVGVASVTLIEGAVVGDVRAAAPVFNLEPDAGEPARFGFMVEGVPVVLDASARSEDGYRVRVEVRNASQLAELLASTVTFWGVPGDPRHNRSRGWGCLIQDAFAGGCVQSAELPSDPLLRLSTSCEGQQEFPAEAEPWNTAPHSLIATAFATAPPLDGCNRVPFTPTLEAQVDTSRAEASTGFSLQLDVPQEPSADPEGIAESDVRSTKVMLPAGLKLNPAAANGLEACSEAQIGFKGFDPENGSTVFDEAPVQCPQASKLGTVQITSPLIKEPLLGSVYQAAQQHNPFGSLFALYIVADAPTAGIHLKLASKVRPTAEGLVASVENSPQLPFGHFALSFFGGAAAPLATSGCGSYQTHSQITPWSDNSPATPSSTFAIDRWTDGGPCQSTPLFSPSFVAGSEIPIAGSYSPFVLQVDREDGTQQIDRIDTVLPPGLTAKLAGIPYCPEEGIHRAQSLGKPGDGAVEEAGPSCPAGTQIGDVSVASGVGPSPYTVHGKAYLAGPYKGAPLSMLIVTPALAGPFDLGVVAVRVALFVDPGTTQITAKSDLLPSELQGVPLDIRRIGLKMTHPNFTLNPTSCEKTSVTGTAASVLGTSATLSSPFQVDACKALGFKPRLSLRFLGGSRRAQFPAVHAVLRTRPGDSNNPRTAVTLPPTEQIENSHLISPCTRVQFNAGACPRRTILGHAVAFSPLLDRPLEGPVYFRSNGGARTLPDIVADLHGQIHVVLVGYVDSVHRRIRTTFARVPDAPISKFRLDLFGGKRGLLVNNRNLCAGPHRVRVDLTAHNGRLRELTPRVHIACGKRHRSG